MIRSILGVIASVVCVTAAAAEQPSSPGLRADVDAALDRAVAEHRIVGAVVLVLRDGRVVYHRAAGYADRNAKTPMSETTLFRLSSLSKPIVTAAVLALVDKGKIRLDQPVTDFLPGFRPALANGTVPIITIRQLLNHTAGLDYGFLEASDGPYHRFAVSDGMDEADISLDEEVRRISAAGLAYEPGTKWGYSVAIDVLGGVVARASGRPLPDAVSQLVTKPLHMADTGFSTTAAARLARPYFDHKPEPAPMNEPELVPFLDLSGIRFSPARALRQTAFPSSGAGMVGTAGDMVRLLEAVRLGGAPILRRATAQSMMANQIADLPVNLSGAGWGFGFGGALLTDPAAAKTPQSRGTWTWGGVYGHNWFVDPVKKLTVVVMTNTAFEGMAGQLPADVRDALYRHLD